MDRGPKREAIDVPEEPLGWVRVVNFVGESLPRVQTQRRDLRSRLTWGHGGGPPDLS